MLHREDMLELTRRMTIARSSITRIAGCYTDEDGQVDQTFNVNFLKLSKTDQQKNLEIAKTIPYAKTNEQLVAYEIPQVNQRKESFVRLLQGINACELKNDALMDTFYEIVTQSYAATKPYAILVFHDSYDIPVKGSDHMRQGESEEVYSYMICAICPLKEEYEADAPEFGFLYPSFSNRSADENQIAIFTKSTSHAHKEMLSLLIHNQVGKKEV